MIIKIDGRSIPTVPENSKLAEQIVNTFITTIRDSCQRSGNLALYYEVLLRIYTQSGELLDAAGVDTITHICADYYKRIQEIKQKEEH